MSTLTILTFIFIILKLTNYIDWSWFYVLMPTTIFVVIYTGLFLWKELSPLSFYITFRKK